MFKGGPGACRYYLSGSDAYRLKLLLPLTEEMQRRQLEGQEVSPRDALSIREDSPVDLGSSQGLDDLAAVAIDGHASMLMVNKQPRMSTSSITSDDFVLIKNSSK